jgi:excisionase family DNA binding protein
MDRHTTARASPTDRLSSVAEVARYCGVAERTVRSWIAAGELRVLHLSPRCVRIEPAALERFLREAAAR